MTKKRSVKKRQRAKKIRTYTAGWPPNKPDQPGNPGDDPYPIPIPQDESPTLPPNPTAADKKKFAKEAFEYFSTEIIEAIKRVNDQLKRYHAANGTNKALERYGHAIFKINKLKKEFTVQTNTPYSVEKFNLLFDPHNDYCLGFIVDGWVVWSSGTRPPQSSYSSSSYAILPPAWP